MIVATNAYSSFSSVDGYRFVGLGEAVEDVSIIVLMLKRNWGAGSIEQIRALSHWLSLYPKEIPCYIVGAESTIPEGEDVWRFVHEERDLAVRELCKEVLSRSLSIGVRGKNSADYLEKILGFREDQVDIIYTENGSDNVGRTKKFLSKNSCPMEPFLSDILKFQARPAVFYEPPVECNREIFISCPYVTVSESKVRLNADYTLDGKVGTIWCEVDAEYQEFLLVERADAFLCALIPFAIRARKDIVCEAPVTEQLLHNVREVLIPQLCLHDGRLYKTEVRARPDCSVLPSGGSVGTGMSCGVDSFYTVNKYTGGVYRSMELTHLYCGNYLYGNGGWVYERAQAAADELQLPLVATGTNVNEELKLPHLYSHFFKTMFGVLSLRKLFRTYFYSSADDFNSFNLTDNSVNDTARMDLLLLYVFSAGDFQVLSGGGESHRIDKTRSICSLSAARKFLNVCLYPNEESNCGKCGKCMRTLLMIDMVDALDLFGDSFNIDVYRKNRLEYFVFLVNQKETSMFSRVYKHFLEVEPQLVRKAENVVRERRLTK